MHRSGRPPVRTSVTPSVTDTPRPFPLTLEACLKKQVNDGAVVDALVAEFVEEASKSLSANGYEFSAATSHKELEQIQGLFEKLTPLAINGKSKPEVSVAAAEFLLEGMYAHKRISRSEERSFTAAEKKQRNDAAVRHVPRVDQ